MVVIVERKNRKIGIIFSEMDFLDNSHRVVHKGEIRVGFQLISISINKR